MAEAFEHHFQRGSRYALLTVQPKGSIVPSAPERKNLTEWLNSPRVKEMGKRLCVATSVVIDNALMRGALTAVFWFWTPPAPVEIAANPGEALDYCLRALEQNDISLPESAGSFRIRCLAALEAELATTTRL